VKGLTAAILILGILPFRALAQSEQGMTDRHRVLAGWLGTVRSAEAKYKMKYGVYGNLAALRNAHLLDTLIFQSDKPTDTEPHTNLVPEATHFEVTAPNDGEHYQVLICEVLEESSICVHADEMSAGFSKGRRQPLQVPLPEDGPDGPLIYLPT